MEKKEFVNYLNEIFKPIGFKKNGNNWVLDVHPVTKIINLQRSNFGNYYYINYGWILKELELKGTYHVGGRFSSMNEVENRRINELLDLDNSLSDETRQKELKELIQANLLNKLQQIDTESGLLTYIKSLELPFSNMIPGIVKQYFKMV